MCALLQKYTTILNPEYAATNSKKIGMGNIEETGLSTNWC
jgi:hypothetical protein